MGGRGSRVQNSRREGSGRGGWVGVGRQGITVPKNDRLGWVG